MTVSVVTQYEMMLPSSQFPLQSNHMFWFKGQNGHIYTMQSKLFIAYHNISKNNSKHHAKDSNIRLLNKPNKIILPALE